MYRTFIQTPLTIYVKIADKSVENINNNNGPKNNKAFRRSKKKSFNLCVPNKLRYNTRLLYQYIVL